MSDEGDMREMLGRPLARLEAHGEQLKVTAAKADDLDRAPASLRKTRNISRNISRNTLISPLDWGGVNI